MDANQLLEEQLEMVPELNELKGTVFIIPIDAPVPPVLEDLVMKGSTLLQRLAPLDVVPESFSFVALSGQEMFDVSGCFSALSNAKKVALLDDLPGGRYDALLMHGIRRAGIKDVQWPRVAELVEQVRRIEQRTKDKTPWQRPVKAELDELAEVSNPDSEVI